jgi:hypothetical protein
MQSKAFLLVRNEADEWKLRDTGRPAEIRQKFKALLADEEHRFREVYYSDHLGRVRQRIFRSRFADTPIAEDETPENNDEEPYRGPARKRGRPRKTKAD